MPTFQRHVFVCINDRGPGHPKGSCGQEGAEEVAGELKRRLYERGLKRIVRANKAGCLDQCAHGTVLVVYPEGVWYGGVTVDDLDELIEEHVLNGRPVERLRLADHDLTGRPDCALPPFEGSETNHG
jgi:(2Fe-2S) ferredoxin